MRLLPAELRKVWGNRVFPILLAVLAAANLLLLWIGTRPTAKQPPAEAYRAITAEMGELDMEQRGAFLHEKVAETESLLRLASYYQQLAYGNNTWLKSFREENKALFEQYDQIYRDRSYSLCTDSLTGDYRLFAQLKSEYDAVAGYTAFLDDVQTKAIQLSGISIFQNDKTGYDLKNIEITAAVYAGMRDTVIDYYPQKGLYTALSYPFTDLILLAAMLLLALLLVRQERDGGLLSLVRSTPGGRLATSMAKLVAFALSLLAVLALLYGVNLLYCGAAFGLGPLSRTIQSVPTLMRCTMQITVAEYLFRFLLAKWAGAFVMGLWVMLAALLARHTAGGWFAALAGPLAMFAVRQVIPATSRLNVIKYANLASLLQTNEFLGNYRNLYWFGEPVSLPLVEWTAAVLFGTLFAVSFCAVFARAQLLSAGKSGGFAWTLRHKTRPTSVWREEGRKLLWMNGAALFLTAFIAFGIYQGINAESYLNADEIYYAYYMNHISGPWCEESRAWLVEQGKEFEPMLEAQNLVQRGKLSPDALLAYSALQQKYNVYQRIVQGKIGRYLKQYPGAWLVYESGYKKLFGLTGTADIQDALLAGLLCAVCFSGLFAMERKGDMIVVLRATPLGRIHTVRAKLLQSAAVSAGIALTACLPHLWQIIRDYGLPCLFAPAFSIGEFAGLPKAFTLSDVLLLWLLCRVAACWLMGALTLWLGHKLGNLLAALFLSAAAWCLPALLALSGMKNGIEWLGTYPLFHTAALLSIQGNRVTDGTPYTLTWILVLMLTMAVLAIIALVMTLCDCYEDHNV